MYFFCTTATNTKSFTLTNAKNPENDLVIRKINNGDKEKLTEK